MNTSYTGKRVDVSYSHGLQSVGLDVEVDIQNQLLQFFYVREVEPALQQRLRTGEDP